jgi:hypothetical protein
MKFRFCCKYLSPTFPQHFCDQITAKRLHFEYAARSDASADCTCDCAWSQLREVTDGLFNLSPEKGFTLESPWFCKEIDLLKWYQMVGVLHLR